METDPREVTITLRPEAGHWQAPPMRRLARLLKGMLRAYGWRCIDIRAEQGKSSQPTQPTKPKEDTDQ